MVVSEDKPSSSELWRQVALKLDTDVSREDFYLRDGGRKYIRNVGNHIYHLIAPQSEFVLIHRCPLQAILVGIPLSLSGHLQLNIKLVHSHHINTSSLQQR